MTAKTTTETGDPPRPRRRRFGRIALLGILLLVALALTLAALGPTLLSTATGRQWVVARVNDRLLGRIELAHLDLSWFDPLRAEGFRLTNARGDHVATLGELHCPVGLYALLWSSDPIGRILVHDFEVDIAPDANGRYGFDDIIAPRPPAATPSDWRADVRRLIKRRFEIAMDGGIVRFLGTDGSRLEIVDTRVQTAPSDQGTIQFQARGAVQPESSGSAAAGAASAEAGVLRIEGHLDPTGQAEYRVEGALDVLKRVPITKDLSTMFLSRINPAAFYRPEAVGGRVSLSVSDVVIPLGDDPLARMSVASGRLDFEGLLIRPRPGGVLGTIFGLIGLATGDLVRAETPGVDFSVRDGRVYYDNFELVWDNLYRMNFAGSVGADDTVDLTVSLPITPELLRKVLDLPQLPGVVGRLAAMLSGSRVALSIGGTRSRPTIDMLGLKRSLLGLLRKTGSLGSVLWDRLGGALLRSAGQRGSVIGQEPAPQPSPTAEPIKP